MRWQFDVLGSANILHELLMQFWAEAQIAESQQGQNCGARSKALCTCRAGEKPKRRKLQPATPISRSVRETLTDFVADDSHFRQHMKQTPVALRTRRATRFGGL